MRAYIWDKEVKVLEFRQQTCVCQFVIDGYKITVPYDKVELR